MYRNVTFLVFCFIFLSGVQLFAQDLKTNVKSKEMDSLRKLEEEGKDSVIFTSRFIRYTTLKLTKDSIQTMPIDTTLNGFHNFNVLIQPRRPTVGTGNLGLSAMPMLFEPLKTIGFDAGFHSLDYYALTQDDIKYYQARTPFTSLYYVSAGEVEQVFKVIHSQNINRNLNIGANFNRIGANGNYTHQRGDDLNGALFAWFQSPSKRYNMWANGIFNTLKTEENGSITNTSIYTDVNTLNITRQAEPINLTSAKRIWRQSSFMLKQTYFVGRIDSIKEDISKKILPTNKIAHTFKYSSNSYGFQKNEDDDNSVFPIGAADSTYTNDSTSYKHVQNEFIYSFFLRAKSNSIIKNELKIDAGIRHDFYNYNQMVLYKNRTTYYNYNSSFQNVTLLGSAGYRFSDRIDLNVDLQQIFQGRNIGDFIYEAKSNVMLSKSAGRIVLGAYFHNKSPEEIYNRYFGNHYNWERDFGRTKTVNFSFNYLNEKLGLEAGAQYYLIDNYLYFIQNGESGILPQNSAAPINLLKITLGKKIKLGRFTLDSYVVYQKTDNTDILRTPEVYTFNSFYLDKTFFKVLKTNVGFDIRYNTPYSNYAYSPAAGQFYNNISGEKLGTTPIVDVWVKASLRKANLFVKCDYVNQGLISKGYYSVNRYPMQDRLLLKFGVIWNFYD
ncbi:putative porin [Pedobacter metabolipauper]|uniref:Putative beta-barrel porin n=1 Tax=Pedobacter metabolipauper TaxID=425513 RepID=A0A4R6ST29_9SPHI|nr:putative porin [Pedobacter metabolipauper]TDQ07565.1 putative beta-barrel porin [Pedobacter metabolipauper]